MRVIQMSVRLKKAPGIARSNAWDISLVFHWHFRDIHTSPVNLHGWRLQRRCGRRVLCSDGDTRARVGASTRIRRALRWWSVVVALWVFATTRQAQAGTVRCNVCISSHGPGAPCEVRCVRVEWRVRRRRGVVVVDDCRRAVASARRHSCTCAGAGGECRARGNEEIDSSAAQGTANATELISEGV